MASIVIGPSSSTWRETTHVVRHQREQQRRDQAGAAPVELPAELVDQEDGRHARAATDTRRSKPVWSPSRHPSERNVWNEQRVGPEDREQVVELRRARDRRALAGVDRLVAVEADAVEVPEPQARRRARAPRRAGASASGCGCAARTGERAAAPCEPGDARLRKRGRAHAPGGRSGRRRPFA